MKTAIILTLAFGVTGGVVYAAYSVAGEKGVDQDRAFVEQALLHHRRSIALAQDEQLKGKDPRAKQLADEVLAAQTKQAKELEGWLTRRASPLK